MKKCMSCGKSIFFPKTFGNVILCKKCASTANISAWKDRNFCSMEDLLKRKSSAIQKATLGNLSSTVIEEITNFFDEYINAGFIASINGKLGQTLKIFGDYCIINTKSEGKKDELAYLFCEFNDSDDDEEDTDNEVLSSNEKMSLVQGLMSGRIVQTGIGVAASATIRKKEKEKNEAKKAREREKRKDALLERIEQKITVGERKVLFSKISKVNIVHKRGFDTGYLQFIYNGAKDNTLYNCEYFFFNDSKKIKKQLEPIANIINEKIVNWKDAAMAVEIEKEANIKKQNDIFDQIRQFKQLLDEGIISEEEFNAKKQQLLSL